MLPVYFAYFPSNFDVKALSLSLQGKYLTVLVMPGNSLLKVSMGLILHTSTKVLLSQERIQGKMDSIYLNFARGREKRSR